MIIRAWYRFLVWALFALRLRRPLNNLQRWLAGEHKAQRLPLASLYSVAGLLNHLDGFEYRKDRIGGIAADWVTDPEVFEARLATPGADDDCDGYHHYCAVQLGKMLEIDCAYHVSIGYKGGGHIACVYRDDTGRWWLLNYQTRTALVSPYDAEDVLLEWASRGGSRDVGERAKWFFFEDTELRRVKL